MRDERSCIVYKLKDKKIFIYYWEFFPLQKGGPDNSVLLTKELSKNKNLNITVLSFLRKIFKCLFKAWF